MPRSLLLAACAIAPLAAPQARAQSPDLCPALPVHSLGEEAFFNGDTDDENDTITFEAGSIDALLGPSPRVNLDGGVLVRRGGRLAGADSASYDPDAASLQLDGNVRYRDPDTEILSDAAAFSYSTGRVTFAGAEFQLGLSGARGAAESIDISQEGTLSLDGVEYTTCPPGSNDWLLRADAIELDTNTGQGTARNVSLRFQGVPFLYAPRLTFPLGDARKTGFLAPEIGSAARSGNEIRAPYYWNIAENYDATFSPRLLTERGIQLAGEFRYLSARHTGDLSVEYLPNDEVFADTRSYFEFNHRTDFANGWRAVVAASEASDGNYFEDLRGSLSATSVTHLNRNLVVDYYGRNWSLLGRVQDYLTIDNNIAPIDDPYRRLPQIRFWGALPNRFLGVQASVDAEVVNFDRDVGVTGWRLDLQPKLGLEFGNAGWFVNPEVLLQHTSYQLSDTEPGQRDNPSRTMPTSSLDAGFVLERFMNGSNRIQTLEPRVLYVHTPFREQNDLPVFDTIVPDLNLVQLFRKNRFLGVDRVADTDQLSVGVTTRIVDGESGQELLTATVGQTRYLSRQGVTLPNDPFFGRSSSDYVAELKFPVLKNFNLDIGHQWSPGNQNTTRSEARLQYRPAQNKILNLAYRFRRGSLEQGDLSWSWPVAQNWNFVGRYNYSLREREVLEQFYGLEYESCCWGLRLVSRRYVSTREGTQDSTFGLQLVLKGMASVGTGADRILERGILGYTQGFQ